ncbi:hypothetical protein COCNU_01G017690 [Cocos nucifera]|uniref:Uncharacterized protein n=1 Tax=Cocos nucifera TaxID=13894 RepID=A0A8K0MVV8_COCNU|nr:hypothetical protein COCNU_01G017690 [Cocos nucifera]
MGRVILPPPMAKKVSVVNVVEVPFDGKNAFTICPTAKGKSVLVDNRKKPNLTKERTLF